MNTSSNTARTARPLEIFLGIISLGLTLIVSFAVGTIFFALINKYVTDPLAYSGYYSESSVRYAIATLIVTFPLLWGSRKYLKKLMIDGGGALRSRIYDTATYILLFIAGAVALGDLVTIVFYFLSGEASGRFLLKSLVVLSISALVFGYYLADRKVREYAANASKRAIKAVEVISIVLVVIAVVWGFVATGGPGSARLERLDSSRVSDLSSLEGALNRYANDLGVLPDSLESLKEFVSYDVDIVDPVTKDPYEYRIIDGDATGDNIVSYELCAVFSAEGSEDGYYSSKLWKGHAKGRVCQEVKHAITKQVVR